MIKKRNGRRDVNSGKWRRSSWKLRTSKCGEDQRVKVVSGGEREWQKVEFIEWEMQPLADRSAWGKFHVVFPFRAHLLVRPVSLCTISLDCSLVLMHLLSLTMSSKSHLQRSSLSLSGSMNSQSNKDEPFKTSPLSHATPGSAKWEGPQAARGPWPAVLLALALRHHNRL